MAGRCGILCAHGPPFDRLRAGLGSTSVLSDESGQQAGERVAYLPYGGVRLGDASTLPTDHGFTGQRLEAGLGLMHYRARFYSPRLGRFVSADTIVPEPGEPQALNRYSYVYNNPLKYMDPSGHQGIPGKLKRAIANFITTSAEISHKVYNKVAAFVNEHPSTVDYSNVAVDYAREGAKLVTDTNPG